MNCFTPVGSPMRLLALLVVALICFAGQVRGQWVTESYPLATGWNGIWVGQDCSHVSIDELLEDETGIEEVWLWNPVGRAGQFAVSPSVPMASDVAWQVWRRGNAAETTLTKLIGGAGYLVKVSGGDFTLALTGKPLPPRYSLALSGLNLVGFPMAEPASSSLRNIGNFFSYDAVLKSLPPVFTYQGGPLSDTAPKNPMQVFAPRSTALKRGKAYWVNTAEHTRYYGPVEVTVLGSTLDFGSTRGFVTIRLRNVIDVAKNLPVTATIAPAPSAAPPAGQAAVAGAVPLLVRGRRDADSLDFTYVPLGVGLSRELAPGEQTEVTLAVDRPAMGRDVGGVFQSLLQVTDSLSLTRIDLGVRAEVPSFTGVWIGAAVISQVDQIIGQSPEADGGEPQSEEPGAPAPSGFPIRLILHRSAAGEVTLMQQIYLGATGETLVASQGESGVMGVTGEVSRFSSASFPPGTWDGTDDIGLDGEVEFSVALSHTAATNPFVHAYHPDHDNLDERFESQLPPGVESPRIDRAIKLRFKPSLPGVTDNGFGSTTLGGDYEETITGLRSKPITVAGAFVLRRVAAGPAELSPP